MDPVRKKLTIGIPTYNGRSGLSPLLESVSRLGLPENMVEILIVDNNSNDGTAELLGTLKQKFPNLRYYINEQNIGRVQNWNKVVDLATGEYLIVMNVNDRFRDFDAARYIHLLDENPEISMLMTDVDSDGVIYPRWKQEGRVSVKEYLAATFLDTKYLEFNSLGVLHQHIFRTRDILNYKLKFEPALPRTTDRVFTAKAVLAGGGVFYYVPEVMVGWYAAKNRYHLSVHTVSGSCDYEEFWNDEYQANFKISMMAGLSLTRFLYAQLVYAQSLRYVRLMQQIKNRFMLKKQFNTSAEINGAGEYYNYLRNVALSERTKLNYIRISASALLKAGRQVAQYSCLVNRRRSLSMLNISS